jgi:nicotinamide-nucleotide amidase
MFEDQVRPYLVEHGYAGREVIHSRLLRICGMGESTVEDMTKDLMASSENPTIAPYASLGEVQLRVTAKTQDIREARRLVNAMTGLLRERLGDNVFGFDETGLERAAGARLRKAGVTLALAESCTGGLLGHRITSVPGSSEYFLGGIVAYSNDAKRSLLGVSAVTLANHGAVSVETAREMAGGAVRAFGSDIGIAITGVAGPSGGSPQKPVGTVCIALKTPWVEEAATHQFRPPRADVNWRSSQQALTSLWLLLGRALSERGETLEPVGS